MTDEQLTAAMETTVERAGRCGFFFDFDGVLSVIQRDPEAVQPIPGATDALQQLSGLVKTVAVVSGRPLGFLRSRLGGLPLSLYGLYGMEFVDRGGQAATDPEVAPFEPLIKEVLRRARAELDPEVLVEDKRLSVGLHYRNAPHQQAAVTQWGQAVAAQYGLLAMPGRMVLELVPPVQRDKGDVIRRATQGLGCAWYFGDDLGDLPAIHALNARSKVDPAFAGVVVAVANPETGDQIEPHADVLVATPYEMVALLHRVIRRFAAA